MTKHAVDLPLTGVDFTGLSEQVKDFHMFRRTDQDLATYGLRCWSAPKATSQPGSHLLACPPVKGGNTNALSETSVGLTLLLCSATIAVTIDGGAPTSVRHTHTSLGYLFQWCETQPQECSLH